MTGLQLRLPATACERIAAQGREAYGPDWHLFAADPAVPDGAIAFHRYPNTREPILDCVCPCGCRGWFQIPLYRLDQPNPGHGWLWAGNELTPTLSPSILRRDTCGWHGFLVNGIWEGC